MVKMNRVVLVFVFALALVVQILAEFTGAGDVSFSGTSYTLTCPSDDQITWNVNNDAQDKQITLKYDDYGRKVQICTAGTEKYYFYVTGKVCDNCYELDGTLLTGVILGDLLFTGGIIILIYHCAQRKSGPSPPQPAGRSGNRAPNVPNRDYEPLNLATRDTGTYAVAGVQRNG